MKSKQGILLYKKLSSTPGSAKTPGGRRQLKMILLG